MQKYLPYVFPAVAVAIVLFLTFRWYRLNTQPQGEISQFAEGVEIEDLSQSELQDQLASSTNFETKDMEASSEDAMGDIRYELTDGKVRFSVYANLPLLEQGEYQVWLQDLAGETQRKAFVLESGKGGYMGSAAISEEVLPFKVIVSKEMRPDDEIEMVLLQTTLEKE